MSEHRPPLPSIYDEILIIGGGSPPTDGGPPIARVGGFWRLPEYGLSYLLAARYVIHTARDNGRQNEVALPAIYLQRHALEVALKDLIGDAWGIKADQAWLAALKLDCAARRPDVPDVPFRHSLSDLITLLRNAFGEIDYGDIPAGFTSVAARIEALEGRDPTRFRYARDKQGESNFPAPVVIPVGKLQEDLEALFEEHLRLDSTFESENLGTQLALEVMALDEAHRKLLGDDG